MIAMTPQPMPGRGPNSRRRRPRAKPDKSRFAGLSLNLPDAGESRVPAGSLAVAALIAAGITLGALWPRNDGSRKAMDETFVIEEEVPPPPPEPPPPPPPDPTPPPKAVEPPEPPPPPQFGLDDEALGEAGDLAVATGNTIMKEAEPVVAPPPPPLPPAPVVLDQPPRILSGQLPEYPQRAADRGLEATVVALITIDTTGRVTNVVIESSGGPEFDDAVLKSARGTQFQPPVRQGRKLPARFRRPFEFKLE
jgi:protein TonB